MKRWSSILIAFAAAACFAAAPARAQDAATLYKSRCVVCHGADGHGGTAMAKAMGVRDFASPAVQQESDADLDAITKNGKNKMPAYGGSLTDAQIKELTAYIRTLANKK